MARNEDEELHSRGSQELNHQGLVMDWICQGKRESGGLKLVPKLWFTKESIFSQPGKL